MGSSRARDTDTDDASGPVHSGNSCPAQQKYVREPRRIRNEGKQRRREVGLSNHGERGANTVGLGRAERRMVCNI